MGKSAESFALKNSPEAEEAADALISCLATRNLTYAEATDALNIAHEKLGEKAVIKAD